MLTIDSVSLEQCLAFFHNYNSSKQSPQKKTSIICIIEETKLCYTQLIIHI
jgi:hypothetical protein